MKTFLLLCSLVVGSSLGEILRQGHAEGRRRFIPPRALIGALGRMIRSPYLFGGVACLAVAFFLVHQPAQLRRPQLRRAADRRLIHHQHPGRAILSERANLEIEVDRTMLVAIRVAVISLDKHIEVFQDPRGRMAGLLYSELAPEEMAISASRSGRCSRCAPLCSSARPPRSSTT